MYDRFAKQVGIISRSYSHLVTAVIYHLNHCHQAIQFGIIIIVIITVINIFMFTFIKMIITRVSSCSGSSTSTTLRLERRCSPSSNSPGHAHSQHHQPHRREQTGIGLKKVNSRFQPIPVRPYLIVIITMTIINDQNDDDDDHPIYTLQDGTANT